LFIFFISNIKPRDWRCIDNVDIDALIILIISQLKKKYEKSYKNNLQVLKKVSTFAASK
jgi:hypothetical protein